MSRQSVDFVLPRPGGAAISPEQPPISGPTERAFTAAFGALMPKASYLHTPIGKAAYYEIHPSSETPGDDVCTPSRVLFIHGVQTPALGLLPLARALHTSFPKSHFVLLDLWGHGLSDTPVASHESSLFHTLIDKLLDRLEWPSAHFIGYSFGGALTVGYTVTRSARVQSFVLVAPAGLIRSSIFTPEEHAHLQGVDEVAARKWIMEWLEGGELVVPADWKERVAKGEVVAEAVKEWQLREHPGHGASVVGVFRDGGVMDNQASFASVVRSRSGIPSLVILGETDQVCGEQELKELGFDKVIVVQQAGHGVVRQRVPEVLKSIGEFWASLEKDGS